MTDTTNPQADPLGTHGMTMDGEPAMPILVAEYNALVARAAEVANLRTAWTSLVRCTTEDAKALVEVGHLVGLSLGERTVSVRTAIEAIGTELRRLPADRAAILRGAADWFDRYDVDSARELRRMADEDRDEQQAQAHLDALADLLPPPADRAALLAEAIRRVEDPKERASTVGSGLGWESARDVLRRMADAVPVSGPGDAADEASSYAERVNAALSEATVNALRERLASGGVPVRTVRRRVADETRQPEAQMPVRVETLARLLCDTDSTLTDGPGWDRISQTPGLGRDEYRNAARYLLRHVTVTQTLDGPAPLLCGDQIPDMTCTLPDGTHDDWKHRDEEGHWWSQMRVPPHSNRDRIAVEDPTP